MRKRAFALSAVAALCLGLSAPPASALADGDEEVGTPIVAPGEDGTGGANDIPEEEPASDTIVSEDDTESWETPGEAPPPPEGCVDINGASKASAADFGAMCIEPVCDANSVWYKVTSSTKSGKVTRWGRYAKTNSTSETVEWSASNSATVKATASLTGTIGADAAIKKVANVTLGAGVDYGREGQIASTSGYKRTVTVSRPGKWVIYRGVASGKGSVSRYKCANNGQSYTRTGTASASTFNQASVTGLLNCASTVTDRVAKAAKSKCG